MLCLQGRIWEWCTFHQLWPDTFEELRLTWRANAYKVCLGKTGLVTGFLGFSALQVSEEGRFPSGRLRNLRLFWGPQAESNSHRVCGYCRWTMMVDSWLGSYPQETAQRSIWHSSWKFQRSRSKTYVGNCHSCCMYVADQATCSETSLLCDQE